MPLLESGSNGHSDSTRTSDGAFLPRLGETEASDAAVPGQTAKPMVDGEHMPHMTGGARPARNHAGPFLGNTTR